MPYRILCNGVKQEVVKASPNLASGLFCYVPLHINRYGIDDMSILKHLFAFKYMSNVQIANGYQSIFVVDGTIFDTAPHAFVPELLQAFLSSLSEVGMV